MLRNAYSVSIDQFVHELKVDTLQVGQTTGD